MVAMQCICHDWKDKGEVGGGGVITINKDENHKSNIELDSVKATLLAETVRLDKARR